MLKLVDSPTQELVPVQPVVRSLLRIHVCGIGIRPLLVADVLRRTATVLHRWQAVVTAVETAAAADALNIHPADVMAHNDQADVHVGCVGPDGISLDVGTFVLDPHVDICEPLALRLALLDSRHGAPLAVDRPAIQSAEATLKRWRTAVAEWATSPGAPMSARYHQQISDAFDDNLAIPAALQALRDLEVDESVSGGAKFETFAYADRLLGLDLACQIGH